MQPLGVHLDVEAHFVVHVGVDAATGRRSPRQSERSQARRRVACQISCEVAPQRRGHGVGQAVPARRFVAQPAGGRTRSSV